METGNNFTHMKDLSQDIKSGEFKHVYLLYGPENYLKLQYRDRLISALFPGDPGMNLNIYDGDHFDEGAVIDQAETLPFFAERRVIRLDRTGLFKASSELLPDYIKSLPDYLYLIFTEEEVDKRNRLYKAVQKEGRCVEFAMQNEDTLSTWILKMLGKENLRIRRQDMDLLLAKTGTDMNHIALEVDKLIHYCAGREEVSASDIELVISENAEDRIFDMITALTQHRRSEAMALYADLLALKEPPLRTLSLIAMQYRRLLIVKELSEEGLSDAQIAQKAGMPPFAVKKSRGLVRSYTPEQLRGILSSCALADEQIKSGLIGDTLCVELLLIELSAGK